MPRKKKPSAASAAKGTNAYAAAAAAASDEAAPDEAARGETLHTHRPTELLGSTTVSTKAATPNRTKTIDRNDSRWSLSCSVLRLVDGLCPVRCCGLYVSSFKKHFSTATLP
jgi:hypothetical protein